MKKLSDFFNQNIPTSSSVVSSEETEFRTISVAEEAAPDFELANLEEISLSSESENEKPDAKVIIIS